MWAARVLIWLNETGGQGLEAEGTTKIAGVAKDWRFE
jgi:hypothetical protein